MSPAAAISVRIITIPFIDFEHDLLCIGIDPGKTGMRVNSPDQIEHEGLTAVTSLRQRAATQARSSNHCIWKVARPMAGTLPTL